MLITSLAEVTSILALTPVHTRLPALNTKLDSLEQSRPRRWLDRFSPIGSVLAASTIRPGLHQLSHTGGFKSLTGPRGALTLPPP